MQSMQSNLLETIGAAARTAASVTGNATSIGAAGENMHRKMNEQNQQTEQNVAAIEEMSLTVVESLAMREARQRAPVRRRRRRARAAVSCARCWLP